jgi:hypothetical protein
MKFYKLTEEVAAKLRSLNLSGSEWKVWSYLATKNPFNDSYQKFELISLLAECKVSKATFYRAIAKLQEAEILDVQATEMSVKFLTDVTSLRFETTVSDLRQTVSDLRQESQICNNSLRFETTFSDLRQKKPKTRSSQRLQKLSDYSDYSDLSDSSEAKPKKQIEEPKKEFLENKKLASKQIGFRELQEFETQLGRVGVKVLIYENGEIIQNEKLTASAIFLGETSEELRSRSIRQFLSWIETKKNVQNIYAIFHTSIRNFVESNS